MDRHLTYVGMTRHRDQVTLYAGRDEFKDVAALSSRLSRAGLKETTLDYDRAAFAERRGLDRAIIVPEAMQRDAMRERATRDRALSREPKPRAPAPQGAREVAPKRSMFDGLMLNVSRPSPEIGPWKACRRPSRSTATPQQPAPSLEQAAERYARAWTDATGCASRRFPSSNTRSANCRMPRASLEAVRPGAVNDLHNAMRMSRRLPRQ